MSIIDEFKPKRINLSISDIFCIKKKYPSLKYYQDTNELIGDISFNRHDIFDDIGTIILRDTYTVLIQLMAKPSSILPIVKEISGKIIRIAKKLKKSLKDLHINDDNTICLTIYEREKEFFPNDFDIVIFIKDILEPYFYWVSFYYKYKYPPWKKYAHGFLGCLELYAEKRIDIHKLLNYAEQYNYSIKELIAIGGNHPCLCNSGKKIINCHKLIYKGIQLLKQEA